MSMSSNVMAVGSVVVMVVGLRVQGRHRGEELLLARSLLSGTLGLVADEFPGKLPMARP